LPRSDSSKTSSSGSGTGFLIHEPFSQLPTSVPNLITLQLPHSEISVFNIYRPPSSSTFSKPYSVFFEDFNPFLSIAATTPHEFIIAGNFNIHLDNPTGHFTSQFLSLLSSSNLTQHVSFPTHDKNILDLVITPADTSLAPAVSLTHRSTSDHFPVFTKLSINPTPLPPVAPFHRHRIYSDGP